VLDEMHFAKNPSARRTKAVFGKDGLGWYARRIWGASGTPAPNNASELWPMLRAYGRTKMDLETFTSYFCERDSYGRVVRNRADHIDELRGILKEFTLRRLKKDVLPELGPLVAEEWYVKPSPRFTFDVDPERPGLHAQLAAMSDDEVMGFLGGHEEEFSTLRRYNALLKAPAVFDAVKFELENGLLDKVVIYGHHREALDALKREFDRESIGAVLIHGMTPMDSRDGQIRRWSEPGGPPIMLASIAVAGTAINLTAAHQGVMIELDWVNANNTQAMQRMHRHGQDKSVTIRVAVGTPVDEVINRVLLRKARMFWEIFDAPGGSGS